MSLAYHFGSGTLGPGPSRPRKVRAETVPAVAKRKRRPPASPKPEALIALGMWATTLTRVPSAKQIADRFDTIDRATSYRWRRHLANAMGVDLGAGA